MIPIPRTRPLSLMLAPLHTRHRSDTIRKPMDVKRFALLLTFTALIGCAREESVGESPPGAAGPATVADTGSVSRVTSPSVGRTSVPDPCPANGLWATCSVEKRLRQSGFVARRVEGESPKRPGFGVRSIAYKMGSGRLELFLYSDERALAKDMAAIDTVIVAPGHGAPMGKPADPHPIRKSRRRLPDLKCASGRAAHPCAYGGAPQPSLR